MSAAIWRMPIRVPPGLPTAIPSALGVGPTRLIGTSFLRHHWFCGRGVRLQLKAPFALKETTDLALGIRLCLAAQKQRL
jgi:hypothetical protein